MSVAVALGSIWLTFVKCWTGHNTIRVTFVLVVSENVINIITYQRNIDLI